IGPILVLLEQIRYSIGDCINTDVRIKGRFQDIWVILINGFINPLDVYFGSNSFAQKTKIC
ncbi:MAG: hypothetical protein ACE5JB_08355, partial [bacterium]